MARKKSAVKKKEKPIVTKTDNELDSLREFALEAEQVDLLRNTQGWQILERDLIRYIAEIGSELPYLDPKSPKYDEKRILYIASDKMLKMVNDYAENKKRALELLDRIDNPSENIVLDVDN